MRAKPLPWKPVGSHMWSASALGLTYSITIADPGLGPDDAVVHYPGGAKSPPSTIAAARVLAQSHFESLLEDWVARA